jgi:hypothetical protein
MQSISMDNKPLDLSANGSGKAPPAQDPTSEAADHTTHSTLLRLEGTTGILDISEEVQSRLNSIAHEESLSLTKAFRAYQRAIGAPEWASYDHGETASFVGLFVTMAKKLVDALRQAYGYPVSGNWSAIVDVVLRRIKFAASEEPPLPKMVHTYPWRPPELFERRDFLEAMRAMIRSQFPEQEAESSMADQHVALPEASFPADHYQVCMVRRRIASGKSR